MEYNVLQLAYLGDAIYEVYIRKNLINSYVKLNELQVESMKFIPAKRQDYILSILIKNDILNEEELEIIRKGRNAKTHSKPKNCDVLTYKYATAFEALVGYLYLNNRQRLDYLMQKVLEIS